MKANPQDGGLQGLRLAAQNLSPAYFAMIMATGIVSLAAFMIGMVSTSMLLFAANIVFYVALVLLSILRAIWFPKDVVSDFVDHQRGPGLLTFVAGSCVLGSQFVLTAGNYDIAFALGGMATGFWIIVINGIFAAFSTKDRKPSLADGIDGG